MPYYPPAGGGAPSGSAGGDLSGTYPNPSVATSAALKSATTNVDTSAATAPSSGQFLRATANNAATWQTVANPFAFLAYVAVNSNVTATVNAVHGVDTSGGVRQLTLPTSHSQGDVIYIGKTNTGSNDIQIVVPASHTVGGNAAGTYTLFHGSPVNLQPHNLCLYSTSTTAWIILSGYLQ